MKTTSKHIDRWSFTLNREAGDEWPDFIRSKTGQVVRPHVIYVKVQDGGSPDEPRVQVTVGGYVVKPGGESLGGYITEGRDPPAWAEEIADAALTEAGVDSSR